jgi:AraC-like DNA-binding protein
MAPAFLAVYGAAGGDARALAERYGLPADAHERRDVDVSLETLDALGNAAAERAGDPNLGFHLALRLPQGSYGLLEYIGRSSATVRAAGERFIRYSGLLNALVSFSFDARGDDVALSQRIKGHPTCVGRHAGEMFVALVVRYLRELTGNAFAPKEIGFAHAAPPDITELAEYFRAPFVWDQGENRVVLPGALLDRPVVSGDATVFALLDKEAQEILAARAPPLEDDMMEKLRGAIRRALDDGQPDLAQIAKAVHMSPRTIQRRLKEQKTSFQDVLDSVRRDLAEGHMKNARLTLGDVAYLLGFSEISAFTRAFKRWTGMTPTAWRDRSNRLA